MTKPTETVQGADAIAKIVAMQAQRLTRIEASVRHIETMLERTDPKRSVEGGEPHATAN